MKYILLFCFLTFSVSAQVGIGTENPENDLHVAGENSTIRIEGLNTANNPVNEGAKARVFIESDGDFTLQNSADNTNSLHFIVQSSDNLATHQVFEHIGDLESETYLIYEQELNSESHSYVELKYNFSYAVYKDFVNTLSFTRITDGQSRVIKTYFTVDDDPIQYGQISQIYYNKHTFGGTGFFFNNGHGYVLLSQGNHVIKFYVEILSAADTVVVVGGAQDSLKIRLYQ
ncbi:MAG TPA: hypothetical protein VFM70_01920 [Salinimicrobium sp.]|nr:hypothetical protein [Salinimicrobium sp.]